MFIKETLEHSLAGSKILCKRVADLASVSLRRVIMCQWNNGETASLALRPYMGLLERPLTERSDLFYVTAVQTLFYFTFLIT